MTTKFVDAAQPLLGPARTKQIAEAVWGLEQVADASTLVKLTMPEKAA